ncbi:MAG: hypothetical protein GY737_16260 [Desulfobacteraceae bacterium]|nr:hypothetical protein [Desulfobacteraceae bacterium]
MDHEEDLSIWTKKGATLSDKTAQKEFCLTQEEIIGAIKAEKLRYRHNTLFGNPCLKLLRSEVEAFVNEKYGENHLETQKIKTEFKKVTTEIRSLKRKITKLEKRKKDLSELLSEYESD